MKTLWLAIIACLLLTSTSSAAPKLPVHFWVNGIHLTTCADEFGSWTVDDQGRFLLQDDGQWYYATISSSGDESRLIKYSAVDRSIPDDMAAYYDPEIEARRREFNSQAGPIVLVSGVLRATVVLLNTSWTGDPPNNPDDFWRFGDQNISPSKTNDLIFRQNYAQFHPNDMNEGGYEQPGSVNDWLLWSSCGQLSIEPDTTRYPPNYHPIRPGWFTGPNDAPIVVDNSDLDGARIWEILENLGLDISKDRMRPIIFLSRGQGGSFAMFDRFINVDMGQFSDDSPPTIGIFVHELGHCVLQLPDLYNVEWQNIWQEMSFGCFGAFDEANQRYYLGFPSDFCPAFKDLIGWGNVTYITGPGEYSFDENYDSFCIVNPSDPFERVYISSWDPVCDPGFMCHHPANGGRILIQHSIRYVGNQYAWLFRDKPLPRVIQPSYDPWVETWPFGEITETNFTTWENGAWFGWVINTEDGVSGQAPPSFEVESRPASTANVIMVYDQLMEEVPLGGVTATFQFLNFGTPFTGWQVTMGGETVSGNTTIGFNQSFEASFSSNAWGATMLGQVLDLPVTLHIQSPDTTLIVGHLQPFVGLRSSNFSIQVSDTVIVESHHQNVVKAEGSTVTLWVNGQERNHLNFNSEVKHLSFAGDPDVHLGVVGTNWSAICRVQAGNLVLVAGPINYGSTVGGFCLADLSEFGWCLVAASGSELKANMLSSGTEVFNVLLPDYISPCRDMAYAGHDPAGDLGSRFGLVGGIGNSWMYVTNIAGDSLYARSAGECGSLKEPLSLDILGNGIYAFVVRSLTCGNMGYREELWAVTYSESEGYYGIGVIILGNQMPGSESGIECYVPYPNTDYPRRTGVITYGYNPFANFVRMRLFDLGHNTPEVEMMALSEGRRHWLSVGYFNADANPDILVFDRGAGVRFLRGAGDINVVDQGNIHVYTDLDRRPVNAELNGEQVLGFFEDDQLHFYYTSFYQWPLWSNQSGLGNRHNMPNYDWTEPSGPINPPDVTIRYRNNGTMDLGIQSITFGQTISGFQVWFSTDQENWTKLAEVPWDGHSNTIWSDTRALQRIRGNMGFYRVKSIANLDGSSIWSE